MLIYKDIFTNDELASDTYPVKLIDDVVFELTGKLTTETTEISDAMIGGNASEEAPEESAEAASTSGINVVLAHRLVETGFTKKDYRVYIKKYMSRVLKKLEENAPDQVNIFKTNVAKFVKNLLDEFDEYQFFMGESADEDGMMIPVKYDGEIPKIYIFKHGVEEEKC